MNKVPFENPCTPNCWMERSHCDWLDAKGKELDMPRHTVLRQILAGVINYDVAKPGAFLAICKHAGPPPSPRPQKPRKRRTKAEMKGKVENQ